MDQVQNRVQTAVTGLLEKLDQEYLRKMQGDMYRCNAKCCDDPAMPMQSVQRCIESCNAPLNSSQKYVEEEISHFQNRLQRCAYQCQDQVRDKVTPSTTEQEMEGHKRTMEACIVKCADDHVALVDSMLARMKETLKTAADQQQQRQQQQPASMPSMGAGFPGMEAGGGAAPSFPRRMPAGVNPLGMPMGPRPGGTMHE